MLVVSNSKKCNLNRFNHKKHLGKTPFECILSSLPEVSEGTYVCFSREDNTYDLTKHARSVMSKINQTKGIQANYEDSLVGNHLTRDILKLVDCDYPFYWMNRIPKPELFTVISNQQTIAIARKAYQIINLVSKTEKTYNRNYHFLEQADDCGTRARRNHKPDKDRNAYQNPISPRKIEKQRIALFVVLLLKSGIIKAWPYLDGDQRMFDFIRGRFDDQCAGITFEQYHTRKNVKNILPSLDFFMMLYPNFDFDCYRYQCPDTNTITDTDIDIAKRYFCSLKTTNQVELINHYRSGKTSKVKVKVKENYRLEDALTIAGYYQNKSDNIEKRFKTLLYFKRMSDDELSEYRIALQQIRTERQSLLIALKKKDIFINRLHSLLSLDSEAAQKKLLSVEDRCNQLEHELRSNKQLLEQTITKQTKTNSKLQLSLKNSVKQEQSIKDMRSNIDQLLIEKNKIDREKQIADESIDRLESERNSLKQGIQASEKKIRQSHSEVLKLMAVSKERKVLIQDLEQQVQDLQVRLEQSRPRKRNKQLRKPVPAPEPEPVQVQVSAAPEPELEPIPKPVARVRRQRVRRIPKRRKR